MNPILKTFLKVGQVLIENMVPGVAQVEAIAKSIPALKGKAKADAVIDLSVQSILAAEGISGKDFVENAEFQAGITEVNEGLVKVLHAVQAAHAPK